MDRADLEQLAAYIEVLAQSLDATTRAEDRNTYEHHLADAARLVPALAANDRTAIASWVDLASRRFGLGFLTGPRG